MRRALTALLCAAALAVPSGEARAVLDATPAKRKVVTVSRAATGPVVDVSRWGQLQVKIKVRLTTTTVGSKRSKRFRITDVSFPVYPSHTNRSAYISSQALPLLRQEVLQLKGNTIQLVSGATDTSYAFVEAIRGALAKAGA